MIRFAKRLVTRGCRLGATFAAATRACASSRRASAAIEFALVLPVALGLYFGAAEVSQGVMTSRKVNLLTRTLVDLLSQQPTSTSTTSPSSPPYAVTATTLSNLMSAAQMLLTPQPPTTLQMTISAIDVTNNSLSVCCTAKVRWSYTQGGTLRPCGQNLTVGTNGKTNAPSELPAAMWPNVLTQGVALASPVYILVADVSYTYQPVVGTSLTMFQSFTPTFSRNEFMYPRTTGQVTTGPLSSPPVATQSGQVCY